MIASQLGKAFVSSFFCSSPLFCAHVTRALSAWPPRCSVCCDHLTNWYYEKEAQLYCRKHYWEKFGELCHGCSLLMTGPTMVSPLHISFAKVWLIPKHQTKWQLTSFSTSVEIKGNWSYTSTCYAAWENRSTIYCVTFFGYVFITKSLRFKLLRVWRMKDMGYDQHMRTKRRYEGKWRSRVVDTTHKRV